MDIESILKGILIITIIGTLSGCALTQHNNPIEPTPPYMSQSSNRQELQTVTHSDIRMKLLWEIPQGAGPFPTIIVHPGRGETIFELRGILSVLADNGYVAVAAGYQRRKQDSYDKTLLPWCTLADARHVIDAVRLNPLVDGDRIGTLGFSLGGAHSLLLAAGSEQVKTAVVYYPMSDFPAWIEEKRKTNIFWRMMMGLWKSQFEADRPPDTTQSMEELLAFYSPINYTQKINIPLLIIHGDKDRTTPLAHSVDLNQQLKAAGNEQTSLMVMNDAAHAFNFHSRGYKEATEKGWNATLDWLKQHLVIENTFKVALNDSK